MSEPLDHEFALRWCLAHLADIAAYAVPEGYCGHRHDRVAALSASDPDLARRYPAAVARDVMERLVPRQLVAALVSALNTCLTVYETSLVTPAEAEACVREALALAARQGFTD